MILVSIESLVVGFMPMPSFITLRPAEKYEGKYDGQVLPIRIGSAESAAIAAALDEHQPDRPATHKLTIDLVSSLGGAVSRVVIDRVEGQTFYATVYLRCANGMFTRVDARPSDAIALAIRSKVPIFVNEDVFLAASCPSSFQAGHDERIEMEEFDKFIENVEPEDFVTHDGDKGK